MTRVAGILDEAPIASVLDVDQGVAMEELAVLCVTSGGELASLGLSHKVTALLLLDGVGEAHGCGCGVVPSVLLVTWCSGGSWKGETRTVECAVG